MKLWKVCETINYLYLSFINVHFYFQVNTVLIRIWEALVMLSTHIATLTLNQPVRPVSHQDKRSLKRRNGWQKVTINGDGSYVILLWIKK